MRTLFESKGWCGLGGKFVPLFAAFIMLLLPFTSVGQTISYAGMQTTLPVTGLVEPFGAAIDGAGNIYIIDATSSNVTEISANGTQSTINSSLSNPEAIASDSAGNLYIGDVGNNRVLKIAAGGSPQTAVGSGWNAPVGVAVDSLGNLYVADIGLYQVIQLTPGGTQTQIAAAQVSVPAGVAVDSYNNVYITDLSDNSLIEVTAAGVPSILFNNTLNQFPFGVAVDRFGNIFVSSRTEGPAYLELYGRDGSIRQLGGSFEQPEGLVTDPQGNVYLADIAAGVVFKVVPGAVDMGIANLCPSSSPAPCTQSATLNFNVRASLQSISEVAVKVATQGGENLDFTTTSNTCTGTFTTDTTCSIGIQFKPLAPGIRLGAVDVVGVVSDCGCASIRPHHTSPTIKAHSGSAHGHDFSFPSGATELATVYLHGIGSGPFAGFDAALINTLPTTFPASDFMTGLTSDSLGDLFMVDTNACEVLEYVPATGITSVVAGSGSCGFTAGDGGLATAATFHSLWRVAIDARGDIYIPDTEDSVIREVDGLTGVVNTIAGTAGSFGYTPDGAPAINALLDSPLTVAVDYAGNLFFGDQVQFIVQRIDASSGILTTVAGTPASSGYSGDGGLATSAQLNCPWGLAVDGTANLYIEDSCSNVIRKVNASTGIISTVAGQGPPATYGYAGDGGPATSALLDDPEGLAVDDAGNIYIADSSNLLVRKVNARTGIITTVAGVFDGGCCGSTEVYTGDGGAATLAGLSYLEDVAVDGGGNFYIADSENHVVRKVTIGSGVATFGSFAEDSTSPAINVTLVNDGNAPLDLSDLVASSSFNLGGSDTSCSGSTELNSGDSCVLGIEFHPLAVGTIHGTITLTDNVGNNNTSTQAVAVQGVGLALTASKLALSAIPSTVALGGNLGTIEVSVETSNGTVVTNSSASITVTITGPGGYSHTVTGSAVNGVATFHLSSVTFSTAGAYTITATSGSLMAATAPFTVGSAAAKLALSTMPSTLAPDGNLGTVEVSVETSAGTVVTSSTASITLTITGPGGYSKTLTVAAVNGVASFDLTADGLSAGGVYTVTATSSGLTSASHTVTVTQDFTLGPKAEGSGTPTQTVTPGASAIYDLSLAPAGSSFTAPIALTATGMPAGATYSFTPATVTPGAAAATTVFTIHTAASTAALHHGDGMPWGWSGITVATLLLPWSRSRRRKMLRASGIPLLFAGLLLSLAGLTGCASGGLLGQLGQTQYKITVTGTSGSLSHSTTVLLIVK